MDYAISLTIVVVEIISAFNFYDGILEQRKTNRYVRGILTALIVICFFLLPTIMLGTSVAKSAIVGLLWFIVAVVAYKGRIIALLFAAIIYYVLLYVLDYIVMFSVILIMNTTWQSLYEVPAYFLFIAVFSKLLLFVITFFFKKIRLRNRSAANALQVADWLRLLVFPVVTSATLFVLMDSAAKRNEVTFEIFIVGVGLLFANIILLILLDRLDVENQTRQDNLLLQQQVKLGMDNVTSLMNAYAVQRQLTHDFTNHLSGISWLLQAEDVQGAREYIESLEETNLSSALVVNSGNAIVDAILNQKYMIARQKNIVMEFQINDLSKLPLSNEDLVTVLANVLDNAIEAAAQVKERKVVRVKFWREGTEVLLSVHNTVSSRVEIVNNTMTTTKEDDLLHGYGLKNIKGVLAKYGYEYAINYENGWFQFSVIWG